MSTRAAKSAALLLLSLVALTALGLAAPRPAMAQAGDSGGHEYLGTWNYDQPDRESMRNVAVIRCPEQGLNCSPSPEIQVPQIGTIAFTKAAGGRIVGRTDQGCTWTFAVRATSLELDSPAQYCFNHVIGSAYTITKWSVTVSGIVCPTWTIRLCMAPIPPRCGRRRRPWRSSARRPGRS
ncbi:hypothetical protein AB0L53_22040 [Nonomuraea sp. NPDC052129]|uniref:hypothetical protein n=1 Tax=Nonomuraea sp. NPDC052129 TaxID=3154651 RepID=UPI0034326A60